MSTTPSAVQKIQSWSTSDRRSFKSFRLLEDSIRLSKSGRDETVQRQCHALIHDIISCTAHSGSFRRKGEHYYSEAAARDAAHAAYDLAGLLASKGEKELAAEFFKEAGGRYRSLGDDERGSEARAARLTIDVQMEIFLSHAEKPYFSASDISAVSEMKNACETIRPLLRYLNAEEQEAVLNAIKEPLKKNAVYFERHGIWPELDALLSVLGYSSSESHPEFEIRNSKNLIGKSRGGPKLIF